MAIDQQLARSAQPLIRWRERRQRQTREKKLRLGGSAGGCVGRGGDVRFTQAAVEPRLSGRNKRVEGGSGGGGGWRGGGGVT